MIKPITTILKFTILFLVFWFLNNGFLIEPKWVPIQAAFFALISMIMIKYKKIELKYWFYLVGLSYVASGVLEIFKIQTFPEVMASTGFGVLEILIISRVLVRSD